MTASVGVQILQIFMCLAIPLLNRSHFSRVCLKGRNISFHIVEGFSICLLNISVIGMQTFSHTCIAYIIMHFPKLTQIFNIALDNSSAIFPQNVWNCYIIFWHINMCTSLKRYMLILLKKQTSSIKFINPYSPHPFKKM